MNTIYIENKKKELEKIKGDHPNAEIYDVTSTSEEYAVLSPFYPHGDIPIPFSDGMYATCVESIWQGLKVFQNVDIDMSTFENHSGKGIKRTIRRFGKPLGHRKGVNGSEILNYFDARMLIYIPSYKWVLDNIPTVKKLIHKITERLKLSDIVLLDYNTNYNFRDIFEPLSHAALIKLYIEGNYPLPGDEYSPMTKEEHMEYLKQQKKAREVKKAKAKKKKQLTLDL